MRHQLRQVPVIKISQKLSYRLVKYGVMGVGLLTVVVTGVVIYSHVGISQESVAKINTTSLPVILESFSGNSTLKKEVILEWVTLSEQNNDYFSIERSEDGSNFEVIKQVNGAGNSSKKLYYNYTDFSPHNGTNYYRLKQTDYDGKFEYSKPIVINILGGNTDEISYEIKAVHPDPFADQLTIEITTGLEGPINVQLLNVRGAVMRDENFTPTIGYNELQLSHNDALEKGVYLLMISQTGQQSKSIRVTKN